MTHPYTDQVAVRLMVSRPRLTYGDALRMVEDVLAAASQVHPSEDMAMIGYESMATATGRPPPIGGIKSAFMNMLALTKD